MSSPRLQKITSVSDGTQVMLNEDFILYVTANDSDSDLIVIDGLSKKLITDTKTRAEVLASSENLIAVTIDSVTTLINASKINEAFDFDGGAKIIYNEGGAIPVQLIVAEDAQDIKDLVDALYYRGPSVS